MNGSVKVSGRTRVDDRGLAAGDAHLVDGRVKLLLLLLLMRMTVRMSCSSSSGQGCSVLLSVIDLTGQFLDER